MKIPTRNYCDKVSHLPDQLLIDWVKIFKDFKDDDLMKIVFIYKGETAVCADKRKLILELKNRKL